MHEKLKNNNIDDLIEEKDFKEDSFASYYSNVTNSSTDNGRKRPRSLSLSQLHSAGYKNGEIMKLKERLMRLVLIN